jgi:putative aldouronate transport system substrate-binding protein
MKKRFFISAAIVFLLLAGCLFVGCRRAGPAASSGGGAASTATYPINTNVTLKYWVPISSKLTTAFTSNADTPFGKYLEEKTGIKIEWIHPPTNASTEQFNLLIASGDLPDILERPWGGYPGGPEKAIDDGIIIRLNDILEKYGPNLSKLLKDNPEYDKMIRTDTGAYYCFPFLRGDPICLIFQGPIIRKDWLDELNLAMPETIDEWHTVLTAFKQRKGAAAPFTFEYLNYGETHSFPMAFNAPARFYVWDDNKVHYGPIEDGRRDFLRVFAQWYREGLVDPDLVTMRQANVAQKMVSGISGASFGTLASRMGAWIQAAEQNGQPINLVGAPYPVLRKGDKVKMTATELPFMSGNDGNCAITAKSQNVEIAARLLDWGYSEDGHNFYNFGIEGESYRWTNGYPLYTDTVMNSPKGYSVDTAIASYARAASTGPLVAEARYQEQIFALPVQKEGAQLWAIDGATKYVLPSVTPTPQESQELARIINEINTYRNEMEIKFILGLEPLTDAAWNAYVGTIKRMGIDRALEIQNAALDRYNRR